MKIYPNAKINEIKKNAIDLPPFMYGPRTIHKKYQKDNFIYVIVDNEINAMHKPTGIMFEYNEKTKKWKRFNKTYFDYERGAR